MEVGCALYDAEELRRIPACQSIIEPAGSVSIERVCVEDSSSEPNRPPLHASASFVRMTNNELAAFYRCYNACCNERRFKDLAEFVASDGTIDGTDRGLDAYAAELRTVVRAFVDYRWELRRRLVVDAPWIATHFTDTGTHREPFLGLQATGRSSRRSMGVVRRCVAGRVEA